MNIEELKRLAEAATPGQWSARQYVAGIGCGVDGMFQVCHHASESDAAYIAAANPAVLLELIRQLEHYQSDSEANRYLIAESRKDEYCAMGWIASCRQAVGDDGSSDMPGFVEYLKMLRQRHDELLSEVQFLRNEVKTEQALSFRAQVASLEQQRDELLAACHAMVSSYHAWEWQADHTRKASDMARAAIAKVEG